jgi:hypothetical protein
MPSQLVDDVRRMVRDREEAGAPITALERALLIAAIHPRRNAPADLVDELESAIAAARNTLLPLFNNTRGNPDLIAGRRAATHLIAAARAVLDYDPAREEHDHTATLPEPDPDRRLRADVDL